jgi:hypothetical protein
MIEDGMGENILNKWIWVLVFGSLWGLSEAVLGGILYEADVPGASVYVGAWALLILAAARRLINQPGTSTALGGIAALFRLINSGFFICHLGGIFLLGAAFDLAAGLWLRVKTGNGESIPYHSPRTAGAGILSALISNASFALIFTFIIRYEFWVSGGWSKVLEHAFVAGGLLALAAAITVPLGWRLGAEALEMSRRNFPLVSRLALGLTLSFWIIGRIMG